MIARIEDKRNVAKDVRNQQTVAFEDGDKGDEVAYQAPEHRYLSSDAQRITDLGKFLERPTLISSLTWGSGGLSATELYPWELFLSNTYIAKKIENYAFFRGTLHLKFVLNANPFVFGACLASYVPVPNHVTLGDGTHSIINRSQKPHIWMYPQTNTGGEMILPFIYHQNFISLETQADLQELGQITLTEVVGLDTANDVAVPTLSVQVYAWLEDSELTGPTTIDNLQGGDEYSKGPVERMSSALATAAASLTVIPEIAPFALATSLGASAVSGIASIFGWTKVPVIEDVKPVRNTQFGGLASSEISDNKDKFTLDPKGELSIDPGILNLNRGVDELQLTYLLQKESYLTSFLWESSDTVGTQLFYTGVTPQLFDKATVGNYEAIYHTVTGYIARMFSHWRGDMIFRFKIVGTAYHKGRLRLTWEPRGLQSGSTDYSNVAYTKIVDISEIDDFEFRVPYLQAKPWQYFVSSIPDSTKLPFVNTTTSTLPSGYASTEFNGTLRMQVLTTLSSPQASPVCSIMVFAYGADNLEYANPHNIDDNFTHLEIQSGDEGIEVGKVNDSRYLINFGENITNLRTLMRRANLSEILPITWPVEDTSTLAIAYSMMTRFPKPFGYHDDSYTHSESIVTPTTNERFIFSNMTTINWVAPMFAVNRGSIQHTYNYINRGEVPRMMYLGRARSQVGSQSAVQVTYIDEYQDETDSPQLAYDRNMYSYFMDSDGCGVAMTNCVNQSSLTAELPMMTGAICSYNKQEDWLLGNVEDESYKDTYNLGIAIPETHEGYGTLVKMVNIGTDFNLHFFLGCPEVYYDTSLGQGKYYA